MTQNQHTVLFFATLRDRAGVRQATLDLPEGTTVGAFKQMLIARFPGLEPSLPSMKVAVNRNFARDEDTIPPGAEIAVFPPVSGG